MNKHTDASATLPLDTVIYNNYSEKSAFFLVFGQKQYCYKKFDKDKVNQWDIAPDMSMVKVSALSAKAQNIDKDKVTVDVGLVQVAKRPRVMPKQAPKAKSQVS